MQEYYVYAYLRKNGTPYYIGKGKGDRMYEDHRYKLSLNLKDEILESRNYCGVHTPKELNRIVVVEDDLNEDAAHETEIRLISLLGRKRIDENGILLNIAKGGRVIPMQKQKELYKFIPKPKVDHLPHFENSIWINNGETETRIDKDDVIPKGFIEGRCDTTKNRMSDKSKIKGGRWYNNGIENKIFQDGDEIPKGFVEGGIKHSTNRKKDWFQITDGKVNKWWKTPDKDIPEGWKKGLTVKPRKRSNCEHCDIEMDVSNLKRHQRICKSKVEVSNV